MNMNEIFRLVRAFPNKHWCWSSISSRSDISFEYILLHLNDHPWNWGKLSQNPHIATWTNVQSHPELPWVGRNLADNPMTPLSVILADPVRFDISSHVYPASRMRRQFYRKDASRIIMNKFPEIDWDTSCMNCNPDLSDVFDSLELGQQPNSKIQWSSLSKNSTISIRDIITLDKYGYWNYRSMIKENPNITLDVLRFLHPRFQAAGLTEYDIYHNYSYNYQGLAIEYVIVNPNLPWNWYEISKNPSLTINHVALLPQCPWVFRIISHNKTLTVKFIKSHIDQDWDWEAISYNSAISIADFDANHDMPWDLDCLVTNPNISPEDSIKLQVPMFIELICRHPLLTIEFILSTPDLNWSYCPLSFTPFKSRHAIKLQRWLRHHNQRSRILRHAAIISALRPRLDCSYLINDFLVKWC